MGWALIRGWAIINSSYQQGGRLYRDWAINRINTGCDGMTRTIRFYNRPDFNKIRTLLTCRVACIYNVC